MLSDSILTISLKDSISALRSYAFAQDNSVKSSIRLEIRDSIAAHPSHDPSNAIRDTANTVRGQARVWIGDSANTIRSYAMARASDTAVSVRAYAVEQDNSVKSSIRMEIRDSISAHPATDPSGAIGDTANIVRTQAKGWIGDSASTIRAYSIARINDTATTLRNYSIARASDTASTLRTTLRSNIGDTASAIRTKVRADIMDSIRNYNNTYRIFLGSIGVGAETIHPPTDKYLLFDVIVINSSASTSYKSSYAFNSTGQFAQIYPFAGGVLDPYYNLLPPAPSGKINFMYTVSTNTLSFNNNLAASINIYVSISEIH